MLDLDGFSDNGRIAAEAGLPERVAKDNVGNSAEARLFVEAEKAPEERLNSQYIEVVPGDLGGVNALWRVAAGECGPLMVVAENAAEGVVGVPQVVVIRVRQRRGRRDIPNPAHDGDQVGGVAGAGHGVQHGAFDPAQSGAGGADAKREHQDRSRREVRTATQLAHRVADVVQQSSHDWSPEVRLSET